MPNKKQAKKKKRTRSERIRIFLLCFFCAAFVFSAGMIAADRIPYWRSRSFYKKTAEEYTVPADDTKEESQGPGEQRLSAPIKVDFERLRSINGDISGWIYCEGTSIDYPILHGITNDTYIHTNYEGAYDQAGSVFLDYRNASGFTDGNTVIYGHNMADGSMFAALGLWQTQDFFDSHPVIWILTPEGDYALKVFSAYVTHASDEAYGSIFRDDRQYLPDYVQRMQERSYVASDVTIDPDANYVLLSTCTNATGDLRSVVHGVLIPADSAGGMLK